MDNLKSILEGEYDNTYPLLGINTDGMQELLGKIARLPKDQQSKVIRNIMGKRKAPTGFGNSRHEMETKLDQLPKEILDGLVNKRLQLCDTRFYVIKEISTKNSIDIFQGTDVKSVGGGNLANQRLEKDNWLLLFAATMRYAEAPLSKERADFTHIPPAIRNGEWELEAGNKKLIGLNDNTCFDTRETRLPIGYYPFESCKIIEPQVEIKMPVKFAAQAEINSFLRVGFLGTSVIPF